MANLLSSTTVGGNTVITTDNIGTYAITSLSGYATQSYVTTQISNLVDSAPGALNTLNELAAALGDDANFSTTVTNSIATKVPLSGSATITGFKTFETTTSSEDDWENSPVSILERDNIGTGSTSNIYAPNLNFHWRSRTSQSLWMNSAGDLHYGSYSGSGVPAVSGTFKAGTLYAGSGQITSTKISNWDTAYGWGNHASEGYITSSGSITGNAATASKLVDNSGYGISSQPGSNGLLYTGQISAGVTGLFATVDNSNSIITLNRHPGNYDSQLGFSSNGNIYYRKFSNSTAFSTQSWLQVWHSGNFTNNSSNWDTAYSWGNHASAGYLTSETYTAHEDTSTLSGTYGSTADGTKIDQITVDSNGHITAITTGSTGDINGVTAGTGLSGGGTSGTPTISSVYLPAVDDRDVKPSTSGIAASVKGIKPFFTTFNGMTGSSGGAYLDMLAFDTYSDSSAGGPSAITFHKAESEGNPKMYIWKAGWQGTTWGTGQRVFADNYHPNADKWTTARTLTLSGDVTGSVSWDGSGNASITTVVADDSHNHDGRYYTETESDSRFLNVSGDTMTGDLTIGTAASAASSQAFGNFIQLKFDNSHSDINRGPNKIVMHDNGSAWIGGFGIHSDTVSYYSGGKHRWYKTTSQTGSSQVMSLDASGNLVVPGTLSASGYNKSNWDTAYGWGNHASAGYITGYTVTSSDVTTALGYTPYQESTALSASTGTFSGDITVNGNQVITSGSNADVKFSVWSGTTYGIGMTSGVTYGGLNDYAMTFCMNNDSDRGFWWGYSGQSKSSGAMSLTTSGHLTVEDKITTSKSEIDFTPTSDTIALDIRGTGTPNDYFTVSNATGGANDVFLPIFFYKAATYGYNGGTNRYPSGVYGGGFVAAVDDTSYPNAAGAGAAMHFNSRTYANNGPLTNRYLFSWGSWLTTHMAMTAGGNLLIGKTSDSGEKLQINGNAHISGNLDVDGTISGYAPSSHTHVISDITSLQSTLDGKQAQGLLDRNGLITTNDWNSFYTDDTLRVVSAHNFSVGNNNAPNNSYNYGAALTYRRTSNEAFQLYFPENQGDSTNGNRRVAFRTGWNGGWSSWRRFVDMIDNVGYVTGGNDTGLEVHSDVGYNQDPGTYFLLRGQADNNQPYALKILLTGNASGNDIEWRRLKMNGADDRMYYAPEGQDQITFEYTVVTPSDARLKDNVKNISNPIEKLSKLNGCEFDWNSGVHEGKHDIGVIAQEVEAVIPEAVGEGSDGIKSVAYDKLVPLLIESVKEQQAMIQELKQEIQNLKNK